MVIYGADNVMHCRQVQHAEEGKARGYLATTTLLSRHTKKCILSCSAESLHPACHLRHANMQRGGAQHGTKRTIMNQGVGGTRTHPMQCPGGRQ